MNELGPAQLRFFVVMDHHKYHYNELVLASAARAIRDSLRMDFVMREFMDKVNRG